MAGAVSQASIAVPSARSSPNVNGNVALDYINGHGNLPEPPASNSTTAPPTAKKGKGKKTTDPNETSRLLAAKINQLELDAAGDKEQEAEIEREVKKATRDLSNLLHGMESPLIRLEAVQKKYTELLADMKRLDRENTKSKKRADQLQKERDQGRSELSKTMTLKEKLEKLCRDFTRDNKKMEVEHKRLEDSEKKSRGILGEKIESILHDVEDMLDYRENPESQKSIYEADELFRSKFRALIEQYDLREIQFQSLIRSKDSEVQFNMARYEHQRKLAENETARSRTLSTQVSTFTQTETELRSQLNIYVEKFKQVEDTLNNSNDLFLTFRKEMEEMSKKTKRLEKENLNLTRKHDLTNRNILEMAEERTRVNKEMENLRKRNSTLESLVRRMQDQGRGPAVGNVPDGEGAESDSDYDEEDYDEEGSEEGEYDDETEEEGLQAQVGSLPTFGPVPPPPSAQAQVNGKIHGGDVNGAKGQKFAG